MKVKFVKRTILKIIHVKNYKKKYIQINEF